MRISGCGHLLMPTGRTSVQSTTSGISLCLNPHDQGNCQWLRQRSINFLSSDFRILSPSHVFSMSWDCDRVSRPQPVKETHDEPEGKTNDLRNRGKRRRNPLLPDATSEGPACLWGWGLQNKRAILKAAYLLCSPHIIHQWTICLIINAICKSEADSQVQTCKNKSTHILPWHRLQKASWNNTCLRRINASHFLGTATWTWQSKY